MRGKGLNFEITLTNSEGLKTWFLIFVSNKQKTHASSLLLQALIC